MTLSLSAETLLIEGSDASTFAHAQFSSAVTSLAVGRWQFSAWLDPQGRVRALFHLARLTDDCYLLLLRGGNAVAMADELRRFVFRAKVRVTALPPRILATGAAIAEGLITTAASVPDSTGDIALGCESHSLSISAEGDSDDAWRLPQLRRGWPWLAAASLGQWLSPALSLQRLHAVVVDKGCYPGQEIVARLHFRGGYKRHLHRVKLSQAVETGAVLYSGTKEAGHVLDIVASGANIEALVVLMDDVVAHANEGHALTFDGGIGMTLLSRWPA